MNLNRYKHLGMFLRALIAVAISFGFINWTDAQIGNVMLAIEALGLVIYATNAERGSP